MQEAQSIPVSYTHLTLEIDDNGRPYWVVTLYDHKVGFSGSDAVGVAILDAQTGDLNVYDIENTPKWVDRIQPESLVINLSLIHI